MFRLNKIIPTNSNKVVFLLASVITIVLSIAGWAVIPFAPGLVVSDINVGILYCHGMLL